MLVRNRTGAPLVLSNYGVSLPPGVWTEAAVPLSRALELQRQGHLELDPSTLSEGTTRLVWNSDEEFHMLWMSPFSLADGYATAAESVVRALASRGFQLYLQPCWFLVRKGIHPDILALLDRGIPQGVFPRVGLCMATPGEFKKLPTPYRIGLTMYEADSPLGVHPEWERDCQNVDRLFVPSKYCRDVFSRFVKRDITVVPLATNLEFNVGPSRIYNHDRPFTFFTHGTLTSRKSPLELIDCFKKAFPNKEDVRLVLKTRMGILGMGKGDLPRLDDPRIKIYPDEDWFPSRLSAEFLASDAYVFPSKGEGFGMTPREAMASGLPTIFTNSTGLKDIADDKYNWPIPYKERVYTQVMGGEWYIPDWDYLIDTMRWVVSNREEAAAKAQEGSRWIIREWGHDAVAREWRKALSGVDPSKTARNLKGATEALSLETFPKIEATHTEFLKAIEATCPRGSKLLNLGVGSGFLYAALQKRGYEVFGVADPGVPVDTGLIRRITGRAPSIEKSVLLGLGRNSRVALQPSAIVSQGVFQHFYDQEIKVILREAIRKYPRVPILLSIPSIHFEGTYDVTSRHLALDNWWNILSEFALSRSGYYSPGKAHMLFVITGLAVVIRASPHRSIGMVNDGVWRPVDARRAL